MPQYLLATQTLVDIAKRDGNAAIKWIEEAHLRDQVVDDADVFISAVTPALLTRVFTLEPRTAEHVSIRQACEQLIDRFVQAGQVADVTKGIADTWAELMPIALEYEKRIDPERAGQEGTPPPPLGHYSLGEKLVFATAMKGTEVVVDVSNSPSFADAEVLRPDFVPQVVAGMQAAAPLVRFLNGALAS